MKVRANMKKLVNLITRATLDSRVAVSETTPKTGSVTINGKFITGGDAPNNAVGGGNKDNDSASAQTLNMVFCCRYFGGRIVYYM